MPTRELMALRARSMKALPKLAEQVPRAQRALFRAFCEEFVRQIRTPLEGRKSADLPALMLSLFQEVLCRPEGETVVRVQLCEGRRALIRSCMADQPFIVDTVRLLLSSVGASYVTGFNVVIPLFSTDSESDFPLHWCRFRCLYTT